MRSAEVRAPRPARPWPWWKRLLSWCLVCVLAWVAVVFVWQTAGANPDAGDLLLWLLAFPVALIAGFYLLRAGLRRGLRRGARVAAGSGLAAETAGGEAAPAPGYRLQLRAQAVWSRAGASAEEALQNLRAAPRPGLHPSLKDQHGLPVFAAPVDDVATEAVVASLQALAPEEPVEHWDEEAKRALALLEPVAEELLRADLAMQPAAAAPAQDPDALPAYVYAHSRSVRAAPQAARPVLHAHLLLPARWPARVREIAIDWLRRLAHGLGHDDAAIEWVSLPLAQPREAWRLIEQIGQEHKRLPAGDRFLLLAADSSVGARAIEELDLAGRLFSATRPEGRIPGEAAAGVLLAAATDANADADADADEADAAPLLLHRPIVESAARDGRSRAAIREAAAVCERALGVSGWGADAVRALVSDADPRPSRSVEAAGALAAQFPELEPDLHGLHFGMVCGDVGIAAPLALLALAAAQAQRDRAPVLALAVGEDAVRASLAVTPSIAPPAVADATSAAAQPIRT